MEQIQTGVSTDEIMRGKNGPSVASVTSVNRPTQIRQVRPYLIRRKTVRQSLVYRPSIVRLKFEQIRPYVVRPKERGVPPLIFCEKGDMHV